MRSGHKRPPCSRAGGLAGCVTSKLSPQTKQPDKMPSHTYSSHHRHRTQAKQPRLPSTRVSNMASGGMAELRAAEQKAAQIVQEARAGKEAWGRGRKREGGLCLSRVDSRPSCCYGGHPCPITHGHMQSWLYLSSICMQASRYCRGPCQKAASCARGRGRERDSSGGVISNRP